MSAVTAMLPLISSSADNILWEKGVFAQSLTAPFPLTLNHFIQHGLHTTGICIYHLPEDRPSNIIEGTKTDNGEFWPDVTCQVKNEETGRWETVSSPLDYGHRSKIEVSPGDIKPDLRVSLDVFLPLVGKYKKGRILLRSGEAADFDLFELLSEEEYRHRHPEM